MVANRPVPGKKYYTVPEANATLPLVRAVIRDIVQLARELQERQERHERARPAKGQRIEASYQEEEDQLQADIQRGQERLMEFGQELAKLGIELKDPFVGLVDFPCWLGNREVYLCWRQEEPEVGYWHELEAGFAGRQKINSLDARMQKPEVRAKTSER